MKSNDIRFYVSNDETIIRLLSAPGCIADGKLTEEAFSLYHKNEDYVSVLRELFITENEISAIGVRIKKWPRKGDHFYGYCKLNVGNVKNISALLDVISCYTENFPSHAGIVYKNVDGTRIINKEGAVFPPHLFLLNLRLRLIAENVTELK